MHLFFSGGDCLLSLCGSSFLLVPEETTTLFCLGGGGNDNKEPVSAAYVSAVIVEQMAQCTVADLGDTSAANCLFHADTWY